ncbi:hypothetical protein [Streptosporangium minutum]|uniref:hypothetical protein n=1 Tax=Streptosporangium minutum TaxID=569862 RepID=UPI00268CA25F
MIHVTTLGVEPDTGRSRTVVCTLHAHVVFTPGYRRGPFTDDILTRYEEIMRAVCAHAPGIRGGTSVLDRYVAALGGTLKLIADFGDEQLKVS